MGVTIRASIGTEMIGLAESILLHSRTYGIAPPKHEDGVFVEGCKGSIIHDRW